MVKNCKNCEDKERENFYRSFEDGKPFVDEVISEKITIRTFYKETPAHLLKWHIDEEDRIVTSINNNDWLFQYDNELPFSLNENSINIKSGVFHRIIKGTTDLIIKIEKV